MPKLTAAPAAIGLDEETLPDAARRYVAFVEEALGVPVTLVGTGAGREAVLALG